MEFDLVQKKRADLSELRALKKNS